jgi:hypothetical protein
VIELTKAEEDEYKEASARVRRYLVDRLPADPLPVHVDESHPDPEPLPVKPRPSSKEPRYGKRDELLGKITALRHQGVNRKQIASQLLISLSFLGKILTEARSRGDMGNDCQNCGKPTNRRINAKLCRACDPACRKKEVA